MGLLNMDEKMKMIKWEEIGISDDFMFGKVMQNPRLCKKLLETILGIEIEKIEYPELQKSIDITKEAKGVRLDVYVAGEDAVFCVEMQARDTHELPRRARYYGGLIDLNLIEKGVSYKKLNQSVVIFICPFDVFGKNRCRYTFENLCLEEKNLPLGDGTTKIFLNAMGTMDDVSPELKSFLDYVAGKKNDDSFVKELDNEVRKVRESKEWRRDYMTLLMRDQENIEKGIKIGLERGLEQGIEQGLEQGIEKGLEQGKLEMIVQLIHDGVLTVREGAGRLHMSESDLAKCL